MGEILNFKKILPLLLVLSFIATSATPAFAAEGNIDQLCAQLNPDLNEEGGCIANQESPEVQEGLAFISFLFLIAAFLIIAVIILKALFS